MKIFEKKICPQCGMPKIKRWNDLSNEQKFLVERLPLSANFSAKERENHLFCTNCWNEIAKRDEEIC